MISSKYSLIHSTSWFSTVNNFSLESHVDMSNVFRENLEVLRERAFHWERNWGCKTLEFVFRVISNIIRIYNHFNIFKSSNTVLTQNIEQCENIKARKNQLRAEFPPIEVHCKKMYTQK